MYIYLFKKKSFQHVLSDDVHPMASAYHTTETVGVKDWKASPFSVMTLFIGPYFISSSVSGKSFPHGTADTMMLIYSAHITCGRLNNVIVFLF